MKNKLLLSLLLGLGLSSASAFAADDGGIKAKIEAAMKLEYRTEEDTKRDENRAPVQALEFMGLKEDMKVIEFIPGGGWYTKILAPVLAEKGELHLAHPDKWFDGLDKLIKENKELSKVKRLPLKGFDWNNEKKELKHSEGIDFKMTDADMLLNIRMYHNLPDADRETFNNAAFKALKPGGTYVVITHTRRHGEENGPENWRRSDPVRVIKEIQDAGFEFTKYSNMFHKADDELRYEVGRKTVAGNTDRFFFVFNKPKK